MNDNYLIPANSKKSQLILGVFRPIDLAIFSIGIIFTGVMLFAFQGLTLKMAIIVLLPVLITGFLVLPVPYYHNVLQLITNIIMYFINRKSYYWKGWSISDGYEEEKTK